MKVSIYPVLDDLQTLMCTDKDKDVENDPRTQTDPVADKAEVQGLCMSLHCEDNISHSDSTVFCLCLLSHGLQIPQRIL